MSAIDIQQCKIAVLYGGTSAEREVSLASGKAVAKGLKEVGLNAELVDTKEVSAFELSGMGFDSAFIALHGRGGEDGTIQGALEVANISYTGSGVLGSALCMDKVRSKQIFSATGIPTAPFEVVDAKQYKEGVEKGILANLGGKAMVKPANEGSSIGMSIVTTEQELANAIKQAFKYDAQVLVEGWIEGPEYTVGIIGDKALPAIHMETPREFYDYKAKYQSTTTEYHCPSGLEESEENELQDIALRAFNALAASGWGRVDVMRNEQGQWQVLEVNTSPGMTETSLVPKAAQVCGMSFSALVKRIVELSKGEQGQ